MRFDSYHPVINFIYFGAAIAGTVFFDHPVFIAISYLAAFIYSVKLNGIRSLIFNMCLLPFMAGYAMFYAYYNHFGVTVLGQNFAGNDMTLESMVYGAVISITVATVMMWLSCVFTIISSDKVGYLFGRISPRLSLAFAIVLRSVPRIKKTAQRISIARKGIGRGPGLMSPRRIGNTGSIVSMVVTWTLESFSDSAESMRSRGYSLKGRTAYSIYRFDNRDRSLVIVIFLCMTVIVMAMMFNQTTIHYDPEIIMNRITPTSYIFYAAYAVFMVLPMGLQIVGECRFRRAVDARGGRVG